jgi:arylsulfatase A
MKRPNIVLIVADDMGYGDCSCYGSESINTPRLDRLAGEGVRFTDFHSNGAVCSPTRAALVTGRYQQRSGIEGVITAAGHRDVGLSSDETTFANVFRDAGYRTAVFGKWHLGYAPEYNPTKRGFDEFRGFVAGNIDYQSHIDQVGIEDWWSADTLSPEDGYTTDLVTAHGVRFIREHATEPFCLYLAHECPHYPYQGPTDPGFRTPGNPEPIAGPRTDQDVAYREMMESMDEGIGRIVDTIDELGLGDDTLIFFFSDNGPSGPGSSRPLRGRKGTVWEGGHRVPAIARWQRRIPAGGETRETAIGMDLFPTFLSVAGIEVPSDRELDGTDLLPLLTTGAALPERKLFWRHNEQKAVRSGKYKLVANAGARPALFDLEADLAETADIAPEHPGKAAELSSALAAWELDVSSGVTRLS